MAINRWDPFRDIFALQNRMNSIFGEYTRGAGEGDALATAAFTPAVDIYEDANTIALTLEVPGLRQEDFDIQVENRTLTVSGERKFENEKKAENYHRVERRYGSFFRAFTLPQTVDTENVQASYDAGVLRIELQKKPETKPRQIKVSVGGGALHAGEREHAEQKQPERELVNA
jgi:HSP20 family protein